MSDPRPGFFRTPFREVQGVYEFNKKTALAKHLREVANALDRAATVSPCRECVKGGGQPRWLVLQEYVNPQADFNSRSGDWFTDIELGLLR